MWQSRSVYRLCPPFTALLHRSYSRVTFDLGFPAFYELQWQGVRTCGKRAKHGPQGAKPVRPDCAVRYRGKAGQRWQFLRAMHDFGPLDAKRGLGGKIRAPCILNRPIAPGNGCIGRGSCHSDLEKHTFRANIARERAYCVHSSKRERIRRDSCQLGTRASAV